ncbi:MAG: heavy metal-associated domain-containing protein [Spirosomataceae bacterium]
MCKSRLERTLNLSSGVTDARLNLDDKVMTVKYRSNRTSEEKIRNLIAKTGYQADDVPAVESAHDRLPKCCQRTAQEH